MAEQAKILVAEAEENNLGGKVINKRWVRWHTCSLCEQRYHGVVFHALGWACWKTYVGRPETNRAPQLAMSLLGSGLSEAGHDEDALTVKEAELSTLRRVGALAQNILCVQGNLANTYRRLGRGEEALRMRRDIYSRRLMLNGEEHELTLMQAYNLSWLLNELRGFDEARSLLRKTVPVARRVLGEDNEITLRMRTDYAAALYEDDRATLDDLREAVNTLEQVAPTARRVLGGAHPTTVGVERALGRSREELRARETGDVSSLREAVEAMTPS